MVSNVAVAALWRDSLASSIGRSLSPCQTPKTPHRTPLTEAKATIQLSLSKGAPSCAFTKLLDGHLPQGRMGFHRLGVRTGTVLAQGGFKAGNPCGIVSLAIAITMGPWVGCWAINLAKDPGVGDGSGRWESLQTMSADAEGHVGYAIPRERGRVGRCVLELCSSHRGGCLCCMATPGNLE